ncbi:MAG TPA: hypothetical protein VHF27_13405 [Acidimicrobiales bacterium]|nr:hypothetical protein [Acidimicrobiales bacterium]
MRTSKYVGFFAMGVGALLVVGAAVLPVSPATERFGPFRIDVRGDSCGPAGVVAVQKGGTDCGTAARKRLLSTSAVGLLTVAFGMALFAGGDGTDHSRIDVPSRRVRRRSSPRALVGSRGSRRYTPG